MCTSHMTGMCVGMCVRFARGFVCQRFSREISKTHTHSHTIRPSAPAQKDYNARCAGMAIISLEYVRAG